MRSCSWKFRTRFLGLSSRCRVEPEPDNTLQSLKSLLILTTKARLTSGGNPSDPVSRPSLYTTNSSLPGRYSQRNRALVVNVWLLELYCVRALTNMRGVIV